DRDRQAAVDAGVVASLEADAARMAAGLEQVDAEASGLVPRADELAEAEETLAAERAAFEEEWGDETAAIPASGAAAEVRGELSALRASVERGRGETGRLGSRRAALASRDETLGVEATRLRSQVDQATAMEAELAPQLAAAQLAR